MAPKRSASDLASLDLYDSNQRTITGPAFDVPRIYQGFDAVCCALSSPTLNMFPSFPYLADVQALGHSQPSIQASFALCIRRFVHCACTSHSKAAHGHIGPVQCKKFSSVGAFTEVARFCRLWLRRGGIAPCVACSSGICPRLVLFPSFGHISLRIVEETHETLTGLCLFLDPPPSCSMLSATSSPLSSLS